MFERQREQGLPTPLDTRPKLWPCLSLAYEAFHALCRSRQYSAGGTPYGIPPSEVRAWIAGRGLDDPEGELFDLLTHLDGLWLVELDEDREGAD